MNDFAMFQGLLSKKGEEDVFARFYDRSIKTDETDDKTGFPVFKNVCFVEIRLKNNNTDVYDQPATEEKKQRFPVEYNRYFLCKKQTEDGTPLEHFAFLTASQIDGLKYRGIFTVEALGALTEQQANDLNIVEEHKHCIKFIEISKNNSAVDKWQKQEEAYKEEIDFLKSKIEMLEKEIKNKSTK